MSSDVITLAFTNAKAIDSIDEVSGICRVIPKLASAKTFFCLIYVCLFVLVITHLNLDHVLAVYKAYVLKYRKFHRLASWQDSI